MIHIVAWKEGQSNLTFLFNPEDGLLYRDCNGDKKIMGRPENFVFPHVPLPQNMKTYPAKKLTIFCKDWLDKNKGKAA